MARTPNRIDRAFADEAVIEAALREAVRRAVLEHRRAGRPIVIWRDGEVVEIEGEEIDRELARGETEADRKLPPAI